MTTTPGRGNAEALARFAALLADRSRAAICLALVDGRAWTAGELATHAGITRSTASEHLTMLVSAGLLAQEHQGRHRYLRLADAGVAQLLEDLVAVVGEPDQPVTLRSVRAAGQLAAARTCYDHSAGNLGVDLLDAMVFRSLIDVTDGLAVTPAGREWFAAFAGEDALHPKTSRPLLRSCLDWTGRRPHLGGVLGATMLDQLLQRGWVVRSGVHRGLRLTLDGSSGLRETLGRDFKGSASMNG
jgi:DNA-binding transcriptional ArsR family regulator